MKLDKDLSDLQQAARDLLGHTECVKTEIMCLQVQATRNVEHKMDELFTEFKVQRLSSEKARYQESLPDEVKEETHEPSFVADAEVTEVESSEDVEEFLNTPVFIDLLRRKSHQSSMKWARRVLLAYDSWKWIHSQGLREKHPEDAA